MIYVTHNLTEVLTLADWVLMIQQGKLVAQGVPKEMFRSANTIRQLPDDEFENVFTVSFAESNREAGTTRVRLASGTELLIPYLSRPAKSEFSDSRQRRRYSRRHRTTQRHLGRKCFVRYHSQNRIPRWRSDGNGSRRRRIFRTTYVSSRRPTWAERSHSGISHHQDPLVPRAVNKTAIPGFS